ncbi:ABC transporter permease [Leucobacter aridicollis]|uniref:ABC transporter permease n=1 Tax=Leucobacter aridicollis TaxID=283878 RepID=UPI0021685147|nr:ABC transporter permease [Leucobacter aridicollis]MCS3429393.1 peptide/nickel transport system permease protein [Leucobacter aridicollis]
MPSSSNNNTVAIRTAERPTRRGIPPFVRYVAVRLGLTVLLMFGVTIVTFVLTNLVPADPVQAALGEQAAANPEIVAKFRAENGLDQPLIVQYFTYLGNVLQGNLGVSTQTRMPVADELAAAFPATIELALSAIVFSALIGIGLGLWAALKRRTFVDQVIRVVSLIGLSWPTFWLALVVYYVFFFVLGIFPGSGRLDPTAIAPPHVTGLYTIDSVLAGQWSTFWDALYHLVLPASVLALYTIGLLTRFARSAVLEVLDMDYVKAATAKGLPRRTVVFGYVLRGAMVPIITVLGLAFGSLLSGTVLVEKVYSWHGLGEYSFSAATKLDLPAIMGVGLVVGIVYIGLNFLVDVLYGVIDPRVRVA